MPDTATIHATCVAVAGRGVLLMGPPGSGKSSLALRLIDQPGCGLNGIEKPARLVADDQVVLRHGGNRLVASAPPNLAGKIEVRGLGIMEIAAETEAEVTLVVELMDGKNIARLPEPAEQATMLHGVELPLLRLDAENPAACARLRAALDSLP